MFLIVELVRGGTNDYILGGLRGDNLSDESEYPSYDALSVFLIISTPWVGPEFRAGLGGPVKDKLV